MPFRSLEENLAEMEEMRKLDEELLDEQKEAEAQLRQESERQVVCISEVSRDIMCDKLRSLHFSYAPSWSKAMRRPSISSRPSRNSIARTRS